jgi:hypothetical protein
MLEGRRVLSTLTVTSSLDSNVFPGDGTLRGEIAVAQSGDTIVFAPSLDYQTLTLGGDQLEIYKNLTIQGPGAALLAISGGWHSRVFQVDAGVNVTISGLTVEEGAGNLGPGSNSEPPLYDGDGGGILNLGTLTLSACTVTNNGTFGTGGGYGWGGGIYNLGTLTLSGCSVTNNSLGGGYGYGGGIYNNGTLTLSDSIVTNNSASQRVGSAWGGGIFNDVQGHLTVLSSTVFKNTAWVGADIYNTNGGWMQISKDSKVGRLGGWPGV